jgi:hypothetical protein
MSPCLFFCVCLFAAAALVKQTGTFKGDLLPAVRNQGVNTPSSCQLQQPAVSATAPTANQPAFGA